MLIHLIVKAYWSSHHHHAKHHEDSYPITVTTYDPITDTTTTERNI